jgi:hypothetical protein
MRRASGPKNTGPIRVGSITEWHTPLVATIRHGGAQEYARDRPVHSVVE